MAHAFGSPHAPLSSAKKVAAQLFNLQGRAEPISSVTLRAQPSQLLLRMWDGPNSQLARTPLIRGYQDQVPTSEQYQLV